MSGGCDDADERDGDGFAALVAEISACRACAPEFAATPTAHAPRPVLQPSRAAPILLIGQAPGWRAHGSGLPFDDPSGDRLRSWLGVDRATFYDPSVFAILPMGFCFPGHDAKGGDLRPPRRCAETWRARLEALRAPARLAVLIGRSALEWYAPTLRRRPLSDVVGLLDADLLRRPPLAERALVLPHPSWRTTGWLRRHPQVEAEILPRLRAMAAEYAARARRRPAAERAPEGRTLPGARGGGTTSQ